MEPLGNLDLVRERSYPSPFSNSPWLPLLLLSLATQKHSPKTKSDFKNDYDYIIVGAGAAGSAVASRLSELPCISVLLLEAGPPPPKVTEIPVYINTRAFSKTDIDWKYSTTPQRYTAAGMKDRKVPWVTPKTLGGGSAVNAMLYLRGNRRNYDEWKCMGAEDWGYNDVLPYFKKLEDNTDIRYLANGFHVTGGPITASTPSYHNDKKSALMEAARSLGYQFVDVNSWEQIGFYDYQQSTRRGQRCSTAKGYLVPSENRTNFDIVVNAMVRKILVENKVAVGVEVEFKNQIRYVRARREVIVSAGAVNTVKLLMLSGIGPMSELKRHKIPLVVDLPVGLNFHDHPSAQGFVYEVDNIVPRFSDEILKEQNIKEYIEHKTGPLTSSLGLFLQAFLSSSDTKFPEIPDYCLYLADNSDANSVPPGHSKDANKSLIFCGSQLLHPYSRGTVSLRSADPYDPPDIDPNFLSDFRDVHDMVEGLKICEMLMKTESMKRLGTRRLDYTVPGCEEFVGDDDMYLRCLVRTRITSTYHLVGTARMGDPKDPRTVVDSQLRVKGVKKLRVVDASIMPTVPWSNTNIPIIMVGEKAADIIKSSILCPSIPFFHVPYFWALA